MKIAFRIIFKTFLVCATLVATMSSGFAGPFSYVYSVDTLPEGKYDVYQYTTMRLGKQFGDYTNVNFRDVVEYGITDRLQFAFYVNSQYLNAFEDLGNHKTGGACIPATADPHSRYSDFSFASVTTEWNYRLVNPKEAPVGVGILVAPTIGPLQKGLDTRLLLQQSFLDNKLIYAANISWLWSWYDNGISWNPSMTLTLSQGLGYRIDKHWLVGMEYRQQSDFSNLSTHDIQNVVFSAGPTIRYDSDDHWWMKFTVLPQLPLAVALNDKQQATIDDGRLYGSAHEAIEMRFQVGFKF